MDRVISVSSQLFLSSMDSRSCLCNECATAKRTSQFDTSLGIFQYIHVPENLCYLGVERVGDGDEAFFMADPWKAIADHYYVHNRSWNSPEDLYSDMRIEMEQMLDSDLKPLELLSQHYKSVRVRKFLSKILRGLSHGNKGH